MWAFFSKCASSFAPGIREMQAPAALITPESSVSRPLMQRNIVLLPHPDGPMTETRSPSSMEKLTPLRMGV